MWPRLYPRGGCVSWGARPEAADSSAGEPSLLQERGLKRRPDKSATPTFTPPEVYAGPPPGYKPDGPLLQTAISPNECYHSMTRPSGHPTLRLYDRSPRGDIGDGGRRYVLAAPVDTRSLQEATSRPVARRRSSELFTPACCAAPCEGYLSHGPDYSRRVTTLKRLS